MNCHPDGERTLKSHFSIVHLSLVILLHGKNQEGQIKSDNAFKYLFYTGEKHLVGCPFEWKGVLDWLSCCVKAFDWPSHQSEVSESLFWRCVRAPWGWKAWTGHDDSCPQPVSRAECPGTCRSMEGVAPDPPASGRRFVEAPGSSGSGALPVNPEYDSEGAQTWMRRMKGRNPGGLWDNKSPYSAAPPLALSPSDLALALEER